MSGEINGTKVLLKKGAATIVGQLEFTVSYGGTPIDISNKSYEDFVTLLDGELSGKQVTISGTLVYNSDTTYRAEIAAALSGTQGNYTLEYPDGYTLTVTLVPNQPSDSIPHGDKVQTSITYLSSGAFAAPSA